MNLDLLLLALRDANNDLVGRKDGHKAISNAMALIETLAWQPIETAPLDGTPIEVYMPGQREGRQIAIGSFKPNIKIIGGGFHFDQPPATLWRPIPGPKPE